MMTLDQLSQSCHTCGTKAEKTFTCTQCNNLAFCDADWPKWVLHTAGAVGWNGKPHEKADPVVVHRLRQILEPSRSEVDHEAELLDDQDTTWFGFGRDAQGHPMLHDYGRFAAIMGETQTDDTTERYPQLASFIGETGAGKSTLIKLLIDRQDLTSSQESRYYSPVTSSNQDRISTTGDVHLYADPASLQSNHPLLLVDCEGLNGGEAVPKQLRYASEDPTSPSVGIRPRGHTAPRKIEWAETPQTQKREFAVSQLYPRILYTFSDVVVFVLRNPRSFESTVLHKLIRWGAASIDKSINQPVLPHAVIVLNATDINVDEKEWDIAKATELLMSDIKEAISREPVLQEYVRVWQKRGRKIKSTKELLECYYASISVIRVPYKGSYMLMNEQAGKLSDLLREKCEASHAKKKQMRMLANTDKLQFYLQAAYDHFTRDLNTPFDFVKETLRHSPVSRTFEGNILNLALSIKNSPTPMVLQSDAEQIFRVIGPVIASCVMLDAVRQKLPGTVSRLLDDRYASACVGALQTFANMYWPCSFTNPSLSGDLGQCCNVRSGHNPKGHQNKQGKIIGNGEYESNFDAPGFLPVWEQLIRASLVQVQSSSFRLAHEFQERTELEIAALLHQERLNELYSNVLGCATNYISYSACLCCLRELPECALPCGHVLCTPCIETYGTRTSRTTIEIRRCPLHVRDIISNPAWVVTTKPRFAGVRTLSLDGGGVRGIVQLQVLREIEKVLGPDLPIQLFFDLIVGTNTGGIIAIGLGVKKWTVNGTILKFKDLCREAFNPREMTSIPLFGALSSLYHGSLYKTQPFEKALKRYFSDQPFFGGSTHKSRLTTSNRVAITARRTMDGQAVVFANYNRPDPTAMILPYQFTRSDVPEREVRMWEAARATAATAPLFKSYTKPETKSEYANNDMRFMCPIATAHHEAQAIWTDVAFEAPDLVLSIGTGRNIGDSNLSNLDDLHGAPSLRTVTTESNSVTTAPVPSAIIRQGRGGMGNYKRRESSSASPLDPSTHKTASNGIVIRNPQAPMLISFHNPLSGQTDRLNDSRQGDRTWNRFVTSKPARPGADRWRYKRISPELFTKLPKFDDVHKMDDLEREAREVLRQGAQEIVEIAHRLVASTFFFEKDVSSVRQTDSGFTCTGSIFCRFRPLSPELKALAWFLISLLQGDFEPYFLLEEENEGASWPVHKLVLSETVLQDMHLQGNFHLDPIRVNAATEQSETKISLCLQPAAYSNGVKALPISGFPRRLMAEDGGVVQQAVTSSIEKKPSVATSLAGTNHTAETEDGTIGTATMTDMDTPVSPISDVSAETTVDPYSTRATTEAGSSYAESTYERPAYERPTYERPAYERPAYENPLYKNPVYERPAYEKPAYERPAYEKPTYERPAYERPAYETSAYEQPAYENPVYEQPAYGQPTCDRDLLPSRAHERPPYELLPGPAFSASSFGASSFGKFPLGKDPDFVCEVEGTPVGT